LWSGQILQAAPITFRFDAEITNVAAASPFDLPLSYRVGDIVQGRFTFDPERGSPLGDNALVAPRPYEFRININGIVAGSIAHEIRVFDNTPISHFEFDPVDTISVGCSEPTCTPNFINLGHGEPFRVRSRLSLIGSESIHDSPTLSAIPNIWNAFLFGRHLDVNFDNEGIGSMGFAARVGAFSLVPEPGIVRLGLCATAIVIVFRLVIRRRPIWNCYAPRAED
jgi:hypothetical protein